MNQIYYYNGQDNVAYWEGAEESNNASGATFIENTGKVLFANGPGPSDITLKDGTIITLDPEA